MCVWCPAACSKLYVWDWKEHTLRQSIDLGADGMIPLEIRFAHEPSATWGYVVSGVCVCGGGGESVTLTGLLPYGICCRRDVDGLESV